MTIDNKLKSSRGECPDCGSECWQDDPEGSGAFCESCGFKPAEQSKVEQSKVEQSKVEQSKVDRVREYMAQTTGSQDIHEHFFGVYPRLFYTDGLDFVAETCGARWLIDAVASHQPALKREEFQVWRLSKPAADGEPWLLTAFDDVPGRLLIRQEIEYSDFPVNLTPFEFWVENNTAMLKEER